MGSTPSAMRRTEPSIQTGVRILFFACLPPPISTFLERAMTRIAIIGSGPTGIYSLKGLVASKQPLAITIFEETPDAGKGTPYHPAVNDRAMLANIASIELPPICQSLVEWLRANDGPIGSGRP